MTAEDELAALAAGCSPPMHKLLTEFGDQPLGVLLDHLHAQPARGWQPHDDFVRVVCREAASVYGAATAEAARRELGCSVAVPTANHFGVDSFADSVQGTLLFGQKRPGAPRHAVIVLGFGTISMNNLTYPMGLLLYDAEDGALERMPHRLPVLPNRLKRKTVRTAAPFTRDMVVRALARLRNALRDGDLSPFAVRSATAVLAEEYDRETVLRLPTYAEQSARINTALWHRLFQDEAPPLVNLQIENICTALLIEDLRDPAGLVDLVLFTPAVRARLLSALDGRRGCWALGDPPGGTVFFWALDELGHRVPLTMTTPEGATAELVDRDGTGYELSPDAIADGLRAGVLLPSLFTCFLVLAFARGIPCVGGYFQAEYLPVMRRGLLQALAAAAEFSPVAEAIARVPADLCLAGLQGVTRIHGGVAIPAGPVEIAGANGLSADDLNRLRELPVRDACLLAFTETLPHVVPVDRLPSGWQRRLATNNAADRGIHLACSGRG